MRGIRAISGAALLILSVLLVADPLVADEFTLQQVVEATVRSNPTITAAELSADAAKYAASGAKALTNPEVIIAPSIVGDAGADSALFFAQPLEINGTRRVRGNIADNQALAAVYEADALRRDIVLQAAQTYWNLVQAQELVKLSRENLEYLQDINSAVQRQYEVGTVPGMQLVKTEVELARARQELAQAELELSQSQTELNTLMNRPKNTPTTASSPLDFQTINVDRGSLLTTCATRPEVLAAQARLDASQGEIKAARLQRVPDVAVQARRESFKSDSDGGVAVAITLPIFDWGSIKAEKRRAQSAALSQEKQVEAVKNNVELQVEQAIQQVNTSAGVVREYQGGILDKSEELAAAARKGYEKGATSYLEVLEAQRTLRGVRSDYITALAEYNKSLAQLEWAAGCDVTEVER